MLEAESTKRVVTMILVITFMATNPLSRLVLPSQPFLSNSICKWMGIVNNCKMFYVLSRTVLTTAGVRSTIFTIYRV